MGLLRVRVAQQRRDEADAVDVVRRFRPGKFRERGEDIPKRSNVFRYRARLDYTFPLDYKRFPNSAVVQVAFQTANGAGGIEEVRTMPAFVMRSVVAGENDNRVLFQAQLFEQVENLPDGVVQTSYHGGKRCDRIANDGLVRVPSLDVFKLGELLAPWRHVRFRNLHGSVRNRNGHITEKRLVFIGANKLQRFVDD